jgi:hypothetical protein
MSEKHCRQLALWSGLAVAAIAVAFVSQTVSGMLSRTAASFALLIAFERYVLGMSRGYVGYNGGGRIEAASPGSTFLAKERTAFRASVMRSP